MSRRNRFDLPMPEYPPDGHWWGSSSGLNVGKGLGGYFPLWRHVGELRKRWEALPPSKWRDAGTPVLEELHDATADPLPKSGGAKADEARFAEYHRGLAYVIATYERLTPPTDEQKRKEFEELGRDLNYVAKFARVTEDLFMRAHYEDAAVKP